MLPPSRSAALLLALAAAAAALAVHLQRRRTALRSRRNLELCRRLPKVELHAHLHGSARLSTIADLAPPGVDQTLLTSDHERSLEGCFALFGAIHRTVTSLAAVRRIAAEVLADFAADNVKYLELRTTPRALAGKVSPTLRGGTSLSHRQPLGAPPPPPPPYADADIEGYVRAVLGVFEQFELESEMASRRNSACNRVAFPLVPRLILSVDRSGGAAAALAPVALAARLRAEGGVGRCAVLARSHF